MSQSPNWGDGYEPELEKLIPLGRAARQSGLSQSHLSLLIRQKKLWGSKLGGRNWYTTDDAVKNFLANNSRPTK
jgi:hypothetical protein